MTNKKVARYETARNPQNGKWYIIGFAGRNSQTGRQTWIPVSDGFATKSEAAARIPNQLKADAAMIAELKEV